MKRILSLVILSVFIPFVNAQETDINKIYQSAIENYEAGNYKKSTGEFSKVIELAKGIDNLSDYVLFRGALIFAGNNEREKTFQVLNYLVNDRFYSDLDNLNSQTEFKKWNTTKEWKEITAKIKENKETQPTRNRENIKAKLREAKAILQHDNGRLWGHQIWNDSIIVIDYDNTMYSLVKLPGSKTDDDTLYYKTMEPNALVFVNTTQKYEGKEYATVLSNYLKDKSATIIHELFHLLQFKSGKFKGDAIAYLDETNARILLRLEYEALRNALKAINEHKGIEEVKTYLKDAVLFRKERQKQYIKYLDDELEIETLEGLANYTGFVLSAYENKYEKALSEIDQRENAETYTRPFPYATGPAYGLIFDYLNIDWRKDLDKIYNFAEIYDTKLNKSNLNISTKALTQAQARNNFDEINKQEIAREERQNKLIAYYTDLLFNKPTLKVAIDDFDNYGRSFNMNGTLTIKNKGVIYSSIRGRDKSDGKNFGNFATIQGKDELGKAGILSYEKNGTTYFVFPLPTTIAGTKITGDFYEIDLNTGWKVVKKSDGNMEIVKE
ncbi:hypothetical protein F0358_13485 [Empedobacter brevis]|uniref:hypothetical protein n=1 Tax=Empedobacter brevis TaxID=247 RepID=UPI00123D2AED|nr:hypothetical protein [Empedobacter brevis]QES93657.1 hypothetical protein F0358_13485 [Empedobacter brevis]